MTNDLVETFFKCPTKCFLRSCGEVGTGNAYADWVRTKNDIFRIEGTKRLVTEVAPDKCAIGAQAMGSPKPAQMALGHRFAVQSQNLQCSCHAVQQIPAAGRGRTAQFVPIRFVFRNKLNRDDKLLVAFDARVLSEVLRREVGFGKIVHGENYATRKVKTSALVGKVRKLTDKIGTLLASPSPPDLGGPQQLRTRGRYVSPHFRSAMPSACCEDTGVSLCRASIHSGRVFSGTPPSSSREAGFRLIRSSMAGPRPQVGPSAGQ